jgi:Zn-dependent M28 family amino/carboxypeptidase
VVFVTPSGDVKGLLGDYYYESLPTVRPGSIVANLNVEGNHMLFPIKSVVALGAEHSSLGAVAAEAAKATGLNLETNLMPEQAFFIRSDQYPFVKKGIPALFFVAGLQSADSTVDGARVLGQWLATVYHSAKDDLDQKLDWESGATMGRVVRQAIELVANAPQRPTWNPGDFFGTTFGSGAR